MRPKGASFAVVAMCVLGALAACSGGSGKLAGAAPTYRISGVVSGATAAGVNVALNGPHGTRTALTDAAGAFAFDGLVAASYTVWPTKLGFSFSPASRDVVLSGGDVSGQDFTAIKGPCAITGGVTIAPESEPIAGVTVTVTGNATAITVTDAAGGYTFDALPLGVYTVTPALAGFGFSPASRVVLVGTDCVNASFTGFASLRISGKVSGDAVSGVTLLLDGGYRAATTDESGAYAFDHLDNGIFTVRPSKPGFTFAPASRTVTLAWGDASAQDFTAAAAPPSHAISGKIATSTCGSVAGVDVFVMGPVTRTTSSDGSGAFTFDYLPDGTYTVTPLQVRCIFSPTSRAVVVSGADVAGQDFTAASGTTYAIYGAVRLTGGEPLPFTAVTLSGAAAYGATTYLTGQYAMSELPPGSYTATARLSGYDFWPLSYPVELTTWDRSDVDFVASSVVPAAYVSGTVGGPYTTGRVHVGLVPADGGPPAAGTSIVAPGPFTIRGVEPGTYRVHAWLDELGDGLLNVVDPAGMSDGTVTVGAGSVSGADVTLGDPIVSWPDTAPTNVRAFPADSAAVVTWDTAPSTNGWGMRANAVTGYRVSWSVDCAGFTGEESVTVPVGWDAGVFVRGGFANGASLCFRVRRAVGGMEGPPSAGYGPIEIGAPGGGVSVSGAVTFGAPAAGHPLWVALVSPSAVVATRVARASTPERFTLSGVPPGEYALLAFVDMDDDGVLGVGDQVPLLDRLPRVAVAQAPLMAQNLTLPYRWVNAGVRTTHRRGGGGDSYEITPFANALLQLPVKVTVLSGLGLPLPLDLASDLGGFERRISQGPTVPVVGDLYAFEVTFPSSSPSTFQVPIGAVIATSAMANPSAPVGSASGEATPTFSWSAPAAPLETFVYRIGVSDAATRETIWTYPARGSFDGMPSTLTSIAYDVDGTAKVPSLTSGVTYEWWIAVVDPDGNEGRSYASFTP